MRQYEIWWAELPAPVGRRPVMILTRTPGLRYLSKCIVAEITSTVRGIAVEVGLGAEEGLPRASVANLDNVHVVPVERLVRRAGVLNASRHVEIKRALGHALDWEELMDA
jgi:mRNA interferase MazF